MQINVRFLENLKLEARFDDFTIIADQPIRYKGDGTAPSPFDYFLASSALCAAYFVKVYCEARNISTDGLEITQNNIVDPDNRYLQTLSIEIEIPSHVSEHDREGILKAMDRCSVKRVIQNNPNFKIFEKSLTDHSNLFTENFSYLKNKTYIPGKDSPLEDTISKMTTIINKLGIKTEIASWRNPLPYVWSVHLRDADAPMCFSNGKGSSKESALCSALGEFLERLSTNYFYSDFYFGQSIADEDFVHYPNEKWFKIPKNNELPKGLMDDYLLKIYNTDDELKASHLIDTNSGNVERGICALPFIRQSDKETIYIPVNLIGNLFVSNGMSAGNSSNETRVQALSEIFERYVKNEIIKNEITLPDVPKSILEKYPHLIEGIEKLQVQGYPVVVKDASLGGKFPVMCVAVMNPKTGGAYASFGAHPLFEVALERSLTELLQGRSFEGLNEMPPPTFNTAAVHDHQNLIDHFIDSTGIISWKFYSNVPDYPFTHWNFQGSTSQEFDNLMNIFNQFEKEVYIADYNDLGVNACRILVPALSEVYPLEDLIWDNNNQAIDIRSSILQIHCLSKNERLQLLTKIEYGGWDNFMPITELIGLVGDETTPWGQLTVGELKCYIHLSLHHYEEAKELTELLLTFNTHHEERKRRLQALDSQLSLAISDAHAVENYLPAFKLMYGEEIINQTYNMIFKDEAFSSLPMTDRELLNMDKHLKMLESYKKVKKFRKETF